MGELGLARRALGFDLLLCCNQLGDRQPDRSEVLRGREDIRSRPRTIRLVRFEQHDCLSIVRAGSHAVCADHDAAVEVRAISLDDSRPGVK